MVFLSFFEQPYNACKSIINNTSYQAAELPMLIVNGVFGSGIKIYYIKPIELLLLTMSAKLSNNIYQQRNLNKKLCHKLHSCKLLQAV